MLTSTNPIANVIARRRNRALDREDTWDLIRRVLILALASYILLTQIFMIAQVKGSDMFPGLKDGDLAFGYRLEKDYAKNDVVLYKVDGKLHVGRVAARETDVVTLDDSGTLLVNGTPQSGEILYPTYAKDGYSYPMQIPEGTVFVLGDYRTQTQDSRDFGPIPLENVEAKVITILRRRGL